MVSERNWGVQRMQKLIRRAYSEGHIQWPQLASVTLDEFAAHVRSHQVTAADLGRHGAELLLALACGKSDEVAVEVLERCFFPALDEYLTRSGFTDTLRRDVFQQLLLHLCTGKSPRLLTYAGRAALSTWLRVATYRFALNLRHHEHLQLTPDANVMLNRLISSQVDLETQATIERARPLFQSALHKAMAELADRERTLLRLSFLDGLSIDAIGGMYGVHRATAARWISEIRAKILKGVQSMLVKDFGLRASEFQSLAFLVQRELHLSLERVLGAA
jgi:RNA polymerase sigma-70 factor, ECF subfamily